MKHVDKQKSATESIGNFWKIPIFKVGECLYRNVSSGVYFALLKVRGKQIRKSLKTKDRKLAERRLRDLRYKHLQHTDSDTLDRKKSFSEVAKQWYELRTSHLKESSRDRVRRNLEELKKRFGYMRIMDITKVSCERLASDRSKVTSASTFNKDVGVLKQWTRSHCAKK